MGPRYLLTVFSLFLFVMLSRGQFLSPCPGIFSYEHDEDGYFGAIKIPSKDIGNILNLTVSIRFDKQLPSKFKGFIQIQESPSDVYNIIHNRLEPVTYKLKFPSSTDVFYIEQIAINDTVVCTGYWPQNSYYNIILTNDFEFDIDRINNDDYNGCKNVMEYVDKKLIKDEISFKKSVMFLEKNCENAYKLPTSHLIRRHYEEPPFVDSGRPHFDDYVRAPPLPKLEPLKYTKQEIYSHCGRPIEGVEIERENWPWLSGIFRRDISQLTLVSGATLISEDTVVAAAQSIAKLNNRIIRTEELGIRVGLYDLTAWTDEFSKMRAVYKIIFHPQFNPNTLIMDNNIALLKMQPVELNSYILPICLTRTILVGDRSSMVEWDVSELPMRAREFDLPIITLDECRKESLYSKITTEETVCARSRVATRWCTENQGSGLFLKREGRTYLGAILSYSFKDTKKECGVRPTRVFTDVTKYYDWIQEHL